MVILFLRAVRVLRVAGIDQAAPRKSQAFLHKAGHYGIKVICFQIIHNEVAVQLWETIFVLQSVLIF